MGSDSYKQLKPSFLTKESVYALAESIAEQVGYEPNADLQQIVHKLGGEIKFRDFFEIGDPDLGDSGSLEIDKKGKFRIYISTTTSVQRDKFTIAHELGHYILHFIYHLNNRKIKDQPCRAERYGSGRIEWEANWFAAAFLMPEKQFKKEFRESDGDISKIAKKFGVSLRAAEVRAQTLELLG